MKTTVIIPSCFSLPETLDCGQAFRWRPLQDDPDIWEGAAFGKYLKLRQLKDAIELYCTQEEFSSCWQQYFDLENDYERVGRTLSKLHPALDQAVKFAPGIRILRQEPWEALCSFILSQNSNIPRIKGMISRLCQLFGSQLEGGFFSFPSAEAIASAGLEALAPIRAGFRGKYIIDAANKVASGEIDINEIARSPVDYGRNELQKIHGVGPKVAECALLYGFHKTECFPMDVWMKRAMEALLPGHRPEEFGENAGLAQQYLFHYSRMHPQLVKPPAEAAAKSRD